MLFRSKQYTDETYFKFTPKVKLENDRKYLLSFRKGMPSKAGNLLEDALQVVLQTDTVPLIERVIPADGSKWVGLYPRITVESKTVLATAYLERKDLCIDGVKKSDNRMDFYRPTIVEANTNYKEAIQSQ